MLSSVEDIGRGHCLGDLHIHTWIRFFRDVGYTPEEAVLWAKEIELLVMAITNHETFEGVLRALEVGEEEGVIVVPGVEITSRFGQHVIGLGFSPEDIRTKKLRIPSLRSLTYIFEWIHGLGAVVVAPHPFHSWWRLTSMSHGDVEKHLGMIDAIEVYSKWGLSTAMNELARENGVARIGCSDAHRLEHIGAILTRFLVEIAKWEDVIGAIRNGDVEAVIDIDLPANIAEREFFLSVLAGMLREKRPALVY